MPLAAATSAIPTALGLASFWLLFQLVKVAQHACSSPLNGAADAHWSVRFTGVWIWWHRLLEQDTAAVHDAHCRLGPLVRLGPNEVAVNDVEGGLKPIYDGRLPKDKFYLLAISYGQKPLFAILDEEPHRAQKKLVAKPYSKTYLMGNEEWLAQRKALADDMVSALDKLCTESPELDLYDVFFAWSAATASTYIFGRGASLNLLHNMSESRRVRKRYFAQRTYMFIAMMLPIPSKVWDWCGYQGEIEWIRQLLDRVETTQAPVSTKINVPDARPTVYEYMTRSLRASKGEHCDPKVQKAIISSEMQDQMVAGVEGSAVALTACTWLLSQEPNRHWQARLREELRSPRHSYHDGELEQLPTLNAVIKETLRIYPPAPGGLPRVTDKAVLLGPPGNQIEAPQGVKVSCQAHSLHRESGVFDEPDAFRPERWLDSPPEKLKEMERWYWAFASGSRVCIGQHFALGTLRVAVAAIWGRFDTQATEKTELNLTQGIISVPVPNKNGNIMSVLVRKVET